MIRQSILILSLAILFFQCSNEEESSPKSPSIPEAKVLSLVDVANKGDASDLELTFELLSGANVKELRVFLIKASLAASFDLNEAEQISASDYSILNGNARSIRWESGDTDTNGDAIVEGLDYRAVILTVAKEELNLPNILSEPSNIRQLQQVNAVSTLTGFLNYGSGGMDTDAEGNIYMGNFGLTLSGGGQNVIKITHEGKVSTFASGLNGASGNDFDIEGNLYQSSITGGFLSKITPDKEVSTIAQGLSGPVGVVVNEQGELFVANCGNGTVSKVDLDGAVTTYSQSQFLTNQCPNGIDIDDEGNLYVANFNSGNIVKINTDGSSSVFATVPGNNNGHLWIQGETMYVVARGAHQIYSIDMTSQKVSLFAGTGARGIDNGALSEATFSFPNDLAFSPDGTKIYINDVDPSAGNPSNIGPVVIRVIDLIE